MESLLAGFVIWFSTFFCWYVGFTPRTSHLCPVVPVLFARTLVLFAGTIEPYETKTFEQKNGRFLSQILGIITDECYPPVLQPCYYQGPIGIMFAYSKSESLYINALNMESMTDNLPKPAPLRIVAGVILGIFAGFFIFFAISLLIGMINDLLGTSLSMSTRFNEDIWSAVLLVVIIIACTAGVLWLVYKTPPTPESED